MSREIEILQDLSTKLFELSKTAREVDKEVYLKSIDYLQRIHSIKKYNKKLQSDNERLRFRISLYATNHD